ncbi:MAG: SMC family ATPase [Candidatus ainarchaeum sp.]|nr:SMC family ATPase [Candidatus ainarchaeum sp.]
MLKSLYLKNWKSHKETRVDLSKGANVIVGTIGAGKTSIVEGIAFSLFGTTQSVISKGISVKDLIMQKPNKEDNAEVILEIEMENNLYKIERQIFENKSSQARIYCNDLLVAGPKPQDVNKKIEELFFVNFDLFMRANYSEQNQLDFFVKLQPRERKTIFDSILGIDVFDNIERNSKQVLNRLKDKLDLEKTNYEQNGKTLESFNYSTLQNTKKELENLIAETELNLKALLTESEKMKTDLFELKKNQDRYDSITDKLFVFDGQILNLSSFIKDKKYLSEDPLADLEKQNNLAKKQFEELSKAHKEKQNLLAEISLLKKQELELNLKLKDYELKNLDEIKKDYELISVEKQEAEQAQTKHKSEIELKRQKLFFEQEEYSKAKPILEKLRSLSNIEKEYSVLVQSIEQDKNQEIALSEKISSIETELSILEKGEKDCPLCGSELDETHLKKVRAAKNELKVGFENDLKKIKEKQTNNKKEFGQIEKKYLYFIENKSYLSKDYSSTDSDKKELDVLLEQFSKQEQKYLELNKKYEKIKKEYEASSNYYFISEQLKSIISKKELNEKLFGGFNVDDELLKQKEETQKSLEKQIEYKKHQQELELLQKQKEILQKEKESIKFTKKDLESLQTKYYDNLAKISSITEIVANKKESLVELVKQEKIIIEFKERLNLSKSKMEKYSLVTEDMSLFNTVAKKTQEDLRKRIIEKINIIFSELWNQLYPYTDFKKVEISVKDGDYKIEIYFNNYKRDLDSFVSGGERSLIALCLRVAISLAMQNKLDLIILDEPTHNLDKNSIQSLSTMINEMLPKYIGQIVVITHDELLSSYSNNVLAVKRNKELDSASSV